MTMCSSPFPEIACTISRRAFAAGSVTLGGFLLAGAIAVSTSRAAPITNLHASVRARPGLNLRSGHDTTCAIIRSLPCATELSIVEAWRDWFRVDALGSTGWVSSWYVTLVDTA